MFDMTEYLKNKKTTPAVLVGQSKSTTSGSGPGSATTNKATATTQGNKFTTPNALSLGYVPSIDTVNLFNGNAFTQNALTNEVNKQLASKGFGAIAPYSKNNVVSAFDPKTTPNANVVKKVQEAKGNSGSDSSGSSPSTDYQSQLNDLYNKVMGYESYTPGTYTPGSTFTPNYYTPSVYQRTYDTSATEAALKAALGDIQGYKDFQYDLNGDLLYQQAVDNYSMLGQQAMADATANAAALTGGYANSYAASVGNQAYQQYLTQANNMIPQFQQMALNTWQSGFDRLLGVYDAVSQQLANELNLENMAFSIWNANESNAANAFNMNESNRYNAWQSNEQNAYNSWLANEQLKKDEWQAGYDQLMDQYNLAKDYYATLEAMNKASGGSGSSSGNKSGSTSNKTSSTTTLPTVGTTGAMVGTVAGIPVSSDYFKQLAELLKK